MDPSVRRIFDVNFNRAREALRVMEEYVRLTLGDAVLTERAKRMRHDLTRAVQAFGDLTLVSARDIQHDVGTMISTDDENRRTGVSHVARAAAKRAAESLRCLEEYGKIANGAAARAFEFIRYELYDVEQAILLGGPRRARLRAARLHVLVTESLCRAPWLDACRQALDGGADVLQLREKNLPDRELLARARQLRELTAARDALFIVNDRPDIARICGADGVHLGRDDLSASDAREIVGENLLIGTSTHGEEELRAALREPVDYLAVGPMFASPTKPGVTVAGDLLLTTAIARADRPIVAIGGITPNNLRALWEKTGAASHAPGAAVAVCQAVIASDDPAAAARALRRVLG